MLLYHGSPIEIEIPDVGYGKNYRDFGRGFYLAEDEIDATSIAVKNGWFGYLHTYEIDEDELFDEFSVLELDGFSDEWLEAVFKCRMGGELDFDIVIGQTAGGRVNDLFELYRKECPNFEDVKGEMERKITNTRFGIQWRVASNDVMDYLELVDIERITRE